MGSLKRKLRDENDKRVLKENFGKEPKHRCPECHRFSLWLPNKIDGKPECVMCELIRRTREDKANEERSNNRPDNSGE